MYLNCYKAKTKSKFASTESKMKLMVVLFSIFIFVETFAMEVKEEKTEKSCDPWPSNLKSLKECCELPKRNTCSSEFSCYKMCSEENSNVTLDSFLITKEQVDKVRWCMEDCIVRFSFLINKVKQINQLYFSITRAFQE